MDCLGDEPGDVAGGDRAVGQNDGESLISAAAAPLGDVPDRFADQNSDQNRNDAELKSGERNHGINDRTEHRRAESIKRRAQESATTFGLRLKESAVFGARRARDSARDMIVGIGNTRLAGSAAEAGLGGNELRLFELQVGCRRGLLIGIGHVGHIVTLALLR